jgi:23S rRNA (cytosine1962-C5)-methyltransferase
MGVGFFNPHALIAVRLVDRAPAASIDEAWIEARLGRALALRQRLFAAPYYRLVHAEADGLPGLVVDRFADVLVVQVNCAGFERLTEALLTAIEATLAPAAIVLRNDSPARTLEGLEPQVRIARGEIAGPVPVREGGSAFYADVLAGQKTGWFFDQARNRAFVAPLARGRRLLDVFCHTGAFAITAAAAGAREALGIDSSEPALALARRTADDAGLAAVVRFERGEAFAALARLADRGERWDVVVADPPPFAKSRKDVGSALRGYRKLARLAAACVERDGFLFVASCSHNIEASAFATEVSRGIVQAGRSGRVLRAAGAGPDHPVHLHLPETAYLKTLLIALD